MKGTNKVQRVTAVILSFALFMTSLTGCAKQEADPITAESSIDTTAIANEITEQIQNETAQTSTSVEEEEQTSIQVTEQETEQFIYQTIFNNYALAYDTFEAVLYLPDGSEVSGIGYCNYSSYYEKEDGEGGFFPAGFIADYGEILPKNEAEDGLIIENLDFTDETYQFVYAYDTESYAEHCVVNGQYVQYGVNQDGALFCETTPYTRGECDESLGALYSYDENRFLYDPDMGNYVPINGESLFASIDYDELEAEINKAIEEQNKNFSQQDVVSAAYAAQEAVVSYLLSTQEETFLGYKVSELADAASELDPMECIRITSDGYVIIDVDNNPPEGKEAVAKWTVGICCGIVIAGSTALTIFVPAARPLSGAITGAAIDVFMQVVIQNQGVEDIQWNKVAVAAVSGAMMSWLCPLGASKVTTIVTTSFKSEVLGKLSGYGVLTLSNAMVSGVTGYANVKIDGEEDGLNAFLVGAAIGAGCTVFASALAETISFFGPKLTLLIGQTKPGQWLNKNVGKTALFIAGHQVHLRDKALEDILAPKSIHEAAKQAMLELNGQSGAVGGTYNSLANNGDGTSHKHEMPSFDSYKQATDIQTRAEADLPAIKMDPEDHRLTASFGNSKEAINYRAEQAKLINEGKFMEAFQMDVDDLTSKFGTKYTEAIQQAMEAAQNFTVVK